MKMILIALVLCVSGCGLVQRLSGDAPDFVYACGPMAVHRAVVHNGLEASREEVAEKIRTEEGGVRFAMSIVNIESLDITWPTEIVRALREYGFEVSTVVGDDPDLRAVLYRGWDKGVIVLMELDSRMWHYVFVPDTLDWEWDYYKGRGKLRSLFIILE